MTHQFALAACARWEERHIQEWLEHHRSVGVGHVYLYCNDDDPRAMLRAVYPYILGRSPFVTFRHWPRVGDQAGMYLHFLRNHKAECRWFSFLDVDEFLVFRGVDDIAAFMTEFEDDTDCLYLNWLNYGNNGKLRRDDCGVLTSHLRRARLPDVHTKMICRASAVDAQAVADGYAAGNGAFWHFLDGYGIDGLRCRNVLHDDMKGYSADFMASADAALARPGVQDGILAKAYVAHFQIKSEEDYLRRFRRGGFDNGDMWKAQYETGAYKSLLERDNAVYDTYLASAWLRWTQALSEVEVRVPPEAEGGLPNVALNKPSWQSSIYVPDHPEPAGSKLVGGGNNGFRSGTYGFHTQRERNPWWIVDLLAPHRIETIRIFNRADNPAAARRAYELDVMTSLDADRWTVIASRSAAEPFGGVDVGPAVVRPDPPTAARFVALRLQGEGFLHLDEIEVFGAPA